MFQCPHAASFAFPFGSASSRGTFQPSESIALAADVIDAEQVSSLPSFLQFSFGSVSARARGVRRIQCSHVGGRAGS